MKTFKNILVLTLITVLAGFLLGYVHDITEEPIIAARQEAKVNACRNVFSDASTFAEVTGFDSDIATQGVNGKGFSGTTIDEALVARDETGSEIGYIITVTSSEGYGGDITLSIGIRNDGTINGIEFLSISETAGLGMKADTSEFKSQFKGINVSQVTYTKSKKQNDYEIEAISGATITTEAVTDAVNAGLNYFSTLGGGETNEQE